MKLLAFTLLVLLSFTAQAQIKVEKLSKAAIPKSITFKGHVVDAAKFSDKDGEHLTITTETGIKIINKGNRFKEGELYAYHYTIRDGKPQLNWQVYDFIKECDFDATTNYLPNTFAITDLDGNGVAEIWLMYKTTCTSDVSPSDLKIIMHEGAKKYAMRGKTRIIMPGSKPEGGKYTLDPAFKAAPAFRNYAINLWNKNADEKFGQ